MWQTGICEIKREPAPLLLNGIKTTAWKRAIQRRTDATPLLKITTCEKSVYFIRLHSPRARQHRRSIRPPGLSLHFSHDLHLILSSRTRLGSSWVMLGWWPQARGSSVTSPLASVWRSASGLTAFNTPLSCLKRTDFLILKAARDPDSTTSLMFVPGFFLFLRTPKQEQSFRERRLYMLVPALQIATQTSQRSL